MKTEKEILEAAIDRMGWDEINAFNAELYRGQSTFEDAGGYMLRAIKRLFGLPTQENVIVTYQEAARALVNQAYKDQPNAAE